MLKSTKKTGFCAKRPSFLLSSVKLLPSSVSKSLSMASANNSILVMDQFLDAQDDSNIKLVKSIKQNENIDSSNYTKHIDTQQPKDECFTRLRQPLLTNKIKIEVGKLIKKEKHQKNCQNQTSKYASKKKHIRLKSGGLLNRSLENNQMPSAETKVAQAPQMSQQAQPTQMTQIPQTFQQMYYQALKNKEKMPQTVQQRKETKYSSLCVSKISKSLEKLNQGKQQRKSIPLSCKNKAFQADKQKGRANTFSKKSFPKNKSGDKQNVPPKATQTKKMKQKPQISFKNESNPRNGFKVSQKVKKTKVIRSKKPQQQKNSLNFNSKSTSPNCDKSEATQAFKSANPEIKSEFDNIFSQKISHENHSHIRNGTECFLSFAQVQLILIEMKMGYLQQSQFQPSKCLKRLWLQLGGEKYGGVVRENLLIFLHIICEESGHKKCPQKATNQKIKTKTKQFQEELYHCLIDFNLKLVKFTSHQCASIRNLYQPLMAIRCKSTQAFHQDSYKKLVVQANNPCSKTTLQQTSGIKQSKEFSHDKTALQATDQKKVMNQMFSHIELKTSERVKNQQNIQSEETIQDELLQTFDNFFRESPKKVEFSPPMMHTQKGQLSKLTSAFGNSTQQYTQGQNNATSHQNMNISQLIKKPLLSVDVNLGQGNSQKVVVYEGQTSYQVSLRLIEKYNIDESMRERFQIMLDSHLKNLLFKIDELSEELVDQEDTQSGGNA